MKLYESFSKFLKEADIMDDSRIEDMCYAYSARTGQTYKVEGNEAIFPDGTIFKFVLNADGYIEYYIIDKNGKATRSALINDRGLIDKFTGIIEAEDKKVDEVKTTRYVIRYWPDEVARDEGFSEFEYIDAATLEEAIAKTKDFFYDQECASCELQADDEEYTTLFGCYPGAEMVNFAAGETVKDDSDNFIEYSKREINEIPINESATLKEDIKDTKLVTYPLDKAFAIGDVIAEELHLPKSGKEVRDRYINSVYYSLAREVIWDGTMSYRYISSALQGNLRPFFANELSIETYAPMEWRNRVTKQLISDFKNIFPEREDEVKIYGPYKESEKLNESYMHPSKYFKLFQDEEQIDGEKWNNSNQEERDNMVKPQVEVFWNKYKNEMTEEDINKLIDDMEDSNWHTECRILTNIINSEKEDRDKDELKESNSSRLNVDEIAKFLEDSVNTLQTTEYTCCRYILDDELAIFVGWTDGADEEDPDYIHAPESPSWVIVAGIKERADALWTDYDYLNFPVISNGDAKGMVADNEITISPNENYKQDAEFFVDAYKEVTEALEAGDLVYSRDYEG